MAKNYLNDQSKYYQELNLADRHRFSMATHKAIYSSPSGQWNKASVLFWTFILLLCIGFIYFYESIAQTETIIHSGTYDNLDQALAEVEIDIGLDEVEYTHKTLNMLFTIHQFVVEEPIFRLVYENGVVTAMNYSLSATNEDGLKITVYTNFKSDEFRINIKTPYSSKPENIYIDFNNNALLNGIVYTFHETLIDLSDYNELIHKLKTRYEFGYSHELGLNTPIITPDNTIQNDYVQRTRISYDRNPNQSQEYALFIQFIYN